MLKANLYNIFPIIIFRFAMFLMVSTLVNNYFDVTPFVK